MSSIHSKDTKPEIVLRTALKSKGCDFQANYGSEKIDIAFLKQKIAIFVDGCFWHACPIHSHTIGTNQAYWNAKLEKNHARDVSKTERLVKDGWIVLRFWEHDLSNIDQVVAIIMNALASKNS